jgi:hypothetical protein
MSVIAWQYKDCYLCKGTGKIWSGYGNKMIKCDHTMDLESFIEIVKKAEVNLKKAERAYKELLYFREQGEKR